MSSFSQFFGGGGGGFDMSTYSVGGGLKPSIILFDTRPGTRTFTVPEGVTKIRAFVVGGGGGTAGGGGGYSEKEYVVSGNQSFSYTVGARGESFQFGGTSSFNSDITATGGGNENIGGVGSGGDVNTDGGSGSNSNGGGASSGNRYGNGTNCIGEGGAGWGPYENRDGGSSGGIDGFGIGLIPGNQKPSAQNSYSDASGGDDSDNAGYGCGGAWRYRNGGIGGGGAENACGGIGGGGGDNRAGGFGLVGVEVLETE